MKATDWFLPALLGGAALFYIMMPLWGTVTAAFSRPKVEASRYSLNQLELDHELGKIDDEEYAQLKPQIEALEEQGDEPFFDLEDVIAAVRRERRVDLALESEILIARERVKRLKKS